MEYCPIYVCTSVLPAVDKNKLQGKIRTFGGEILKTWDNKCNFLVAGALRLTEKILLALIHGVPIVCPEFIDKVNLCEKNGNLSTRVAFFPMLFLNKTFDTQFLP